MSKDGEEFGGLHSHQRMLTDDGHDRCRGPSKRSELVLQWKSQVLRGWGGPFGKVSERGKCISGRRSCTGRQWLANHGFAYIHVRALKFT